MYMRLVAVISLVGIGLIGRLIPHPPNATPITAVSIAAARYLGTTWALIVPIASMVLADALIGWYDWRILLSVYGSIVCISVLNLAIRKIRGPLPVMLAVFGASVLFFFITNTTVWAFSPWYEKSLAGLLYAYELGLPFFRTMLLGDLVYTPILLGAIECASFVRSTQYRVIRSPFIARRSL